MFACGKKQLSLRHGSLSRHKGTGQALLWGAGNPDYWDLFYAADRIAASLQLISRQQTGAQPAINFASAYLLSQVIEQVSGQSVFNFAHRYLFQPLGITTYATDHDDLTHDPMVDAENEALT